MTHQHIPIPLVDVPFLDKGLRPVHQFCCLICGETLELNSITPAWPTAPPADALPGNAQYFPETTAA